MRRRIGLLGVLMLSALPWLSLAQSKAPTLKEQLEAQFAPETVLVVQKDGILGVAPMIIKPCAANYQNGKFTPSDASCSAPIKGSSRMLTVGEKIHPTEIQVDFGKEVISLGVVECESCNSGIPAPAYKARVDFHFARGYLEKGNVPEIEDTIAELLPMGSNEEQHTQTSQEANHLLTNEDVVKMATAKLGDGIIISAIKSDPCCNFDTSVNGMVSLKKAGVSDAVIQAMRDAQAAANAAPSDQGGGPGGQDQASNAGGDSASSEVSDNPNSNGDPSPAYWDGQLRLYQSVTFSARESCGRPHECLEGSLIVTPTSIKFTAGGGVVLDAPMSGIHPVKPRGRCRVGLEANNKEWQFITVMPPGYICETASSYLSGLISRLTSKSTPSTSSCADYDSCMRNGAASLEQPEGGAQALAEFQKASEISPSKGDPWAGMGDAYMQMAQYGYSPTMWDKALQNGATLTINACRAGFSCGDTGSFLVSTKEISFINKKGEKEFVAVPSSITSVEAASHGLGSTYYWQLQFQGKKYRFYFGPRGMQCRSNFICPEPGLTQQKIVAEYVHTTVDKLRAGSFGLQQSKP